jgi:hypothetical protein
VNIVSAALRWNLASHAREPAGEQAAHVTDLDDGEFRRTLWLAGEQIGYRRDSVELEGLVGVELELHSLN